MLKLWRKANLQVWVELLSYLLTAGILLYLLITDKYLAFVAPRMAPLIAFMTGITVLWAIVSFRYIKHRRYRSSYFHCLVLLFPTLLLLFTAPGLAINKLGLPSQDSAATLSNSPPPVTAIIPPKPDLPDYSDVKVEQVTPKAVPPATSTATSTTTDTTPPPAPATNTTAGQNSGKRIIVDDTDGIDTENRTITINSENYYDTIFKVSTKLPRYLGYKMTISGYVLRNDQYFTHGDFMVARLAMTCCSADIAPVGVVAFYSDADEIFNNQWVKITGTVMRNSYHGMPQIGLKVTKLQRIKPIPGYVYPQ